jgi:uncharacterized Zn finger protein
VAGASDAGTGHNQDVPRSAVPPSAERGRGSAGTGHTDVPRSAEPASAERGRGSAGTGHTERELQERWRAVLPGREDEAAERRLAQGAAFYRSGRVAGLRLAPGRLSASVQGARATPYHVEVLVEPLDDHAWREVVGAIASELRLAAGLLAGRWPDGLLATLAERGIDLVGDPSALDVRCPCGEADRPCAHIVALWEAVAARIENDPFALLHLRGRGRQRLLADLAAARPGHGGPGAARVGVGARAAERGATAPVPRGELDVASRRRPDPGAAALRLLGDPPGWTGAGSAYETFAPLIEAAAREAERIMR